MPCPFIEPPKKTRKLVKEILEELQQPGVNLTESDLHKILSRVGNDALIDRYLESLSVSQYSKTAKRWSSIPQDPDCEVLLYDPLSNLLNEVLTHCDLYDSTRRKFLNTFDSQAAHENIYWPETITKRFPAVRSVIMDDGYFPTDESIENLRISRTQCGAPVEVRLDEDDYGDDCLAQCGIYAKQVFINQLGRRFVYVPLITERRLRLYRFDRGGVLITPWIDYHQHPEVLIRVVLLTCGQPSDLVGANLAISWKGNDQFVMVDSSEYKVIEEIASNSGIVGRGTCIWGVEDEEGRQRVIKYMWRDAPIPGTKSRKPELELLAKVKGVEGVVQLVAHSPEYSLFEDRGFTPDHPFEINDRLASFIVMERYGKNITEFSFPLQLLHILRDAIAGHRNMWRRGVIHRDISFNNILQGGPDAQEGFHGVLIDMDMAEYRSYRKQLPECSWLFGTPAFQSYKDMKTQLVDPGKDTPIHTYMEDLEAFLWVFLCITTGYEALPGGGSRQIDPPPMELRKLIASDPEVACSNKLRILQGSCSSFSLHPSYPPQFDTLKKQLMYFFEFYSLRKPQGRRFPITRESLAGDAECHYDQIIGYINSTIADIEADKIRGDEELNLDFYDQDWQIKRRAWTEKEVSGTDEDPNYFDSADESGDEFDLSTPSVSETSSYDVRSFDSRAGAAHKEPNHKRLTDTRPAPEINVQSVSSNSGMHPALLAVWIEQTPVRKSIADTRCLDTSTSQSTSESSSKRGRDEDDGVSESVGVKRRRSEPTP